ncbi:MAG TPA: hypothetical protein EYH38_02345 [Leucothrix sp.]|nr:hypothetical protein [Leucothrix sp.]
MNGYSKINLKMMGGKQQSDNKIPIDKASFSIFLKGLSSDGFLRYSELEAELDNLKQQAQWSLQENGEFPEGQDQIWQLYDEIDENIQRLPSIILNELFNKDSRIQLKAESLNSSGQSELIGELRRIDASTQMILKNQNENPLMQKAQIRDRIIFKSQNEKSLKKGGGGFNTLLSTLHGNARVKLDADLFLFLQNYSPIKQSEFKLMLKDSKLLMQ